MNTEPIVIGDDDLYMCPFCGMEMPMYAPDMWVCVICDYEVDLEG